MPRVSVELSDDELRQVRILAAERGVAPPGLIREFLVGLGVGTPGGAVTPVPAPVSGFDTVLPVASKAKKPATRDKTVGIRRVPDDVMAPTPGVTAYYEVEGDSAKCAHVNQTTVSHGVYCADCAYKLR